MTTTQLNPTTTVHPHAEHAGGSRSATLGMILFLAAEAMFFLGLISALLVLGPAHSAVFRRSATQLSTTGLFASAACLVAMSAVAVRRPWSVTMRWAAVGIGVLFLGLQGLQYWRLVRHETVVANIDGHLKVLDGTAREKDGKLTITGTVADLPDEFDPHAMVLPPAAGSGTFTVPLPVVDRQSYGPGRSNFFSSYFMLTQVHAVHLIGGLLALAWLTARRRARFPAMEIYWHTMNAIGVVCLVAIWLV